jgi:hypothetical protein
MPNQEALSVLHEYNTRKLDNGLFPKKLHHFGGSFEGFYKNAQGVKSFKPLECNQLLIDRLKFIYGQIGNGTSPDRSALETLIEQSFIKVPCSHYPNCRGHRFDPLCKHRK